MARSAGCAVVPELESRPRPGGQVPATAVDLACQYCQRYIRSRQHDDIDKVTSGRPPATQPLQPRRLRGLE